MRHLVSHTQLLNPTPRMTKHHTVIGDGLTAAEFAATAPLSPGDRLTVIGPNVATLGRGVAYARAPVEAPWRYAYLLNSPSYAVDPDFAQWMPQNREWLIEQMSGRRPDWLAAGQPWLDTNDLASLNAPREIYGDFSQQRTATALAALRTRGIQVELLAASVTELGTGPNGLTIELDDGQIISADSADVATGSPTGQRFDGDSSDRAFSQLYGNESSIAEKIGPRGSIICIGANAAMLDLLRLCQSIQADDDIRLTAISPHGQLPVALIPSTTKSPKTIELNPPYDTADAFLQDLFKLKQQTLAAGENFEELRAGLRLLFMQTSLSSLLADAEEARKVARPLYRAFQGGTRDSIHDFQRLMKSRQCALLPGEVSSIETNTNQATVHYRDNDGKRQSIKADVVVNCAGPGPLSRFDPFTMKMIEHGWISSCHHSGGIMTGEQCRTSVPGVRYLGPAVTSVGDTALPIPFYDALRLRLTVQALNQAPIEST